MGVYEQIARFVLSNPDLHASALMKQLLLSLYSDAFQINLYVLFAILDVPNTRLVLDALEHYARVGEDEELRRAAKQLLEVQDDQ
ncbi:hypothetical protein [Deinococcus cellulosilyticus]|uniref:Uncharacterized protein n=1 Tax=Deinococcus cellulosilyticus (strain DSM 18568 / NBRC 106333 / KACC 11606 / 5516J-15) TaxID=1223518 RepID=A0A511NAV1_DEIC1|nr:hypothetical protein [Deinococcus cellulosilyticus]GEM49638.1 hypothetical protein DC3_52730 [Deinococcus cellulosilyticus NBRC 106333 = KACC 11606]